MESSALRSPSSRPSNPDKPQSALGMALMHLGWFCRAVLSELAWPAASLHFPVFLSLQLIGRTQELDGIIRERQKAKQLFGSCL